MIKLFNQIQPKLKFPEQVCDESEVLHALEVLASQDRLSEDDYYDVIEAIGCIELALSKSISHIINNAMCLSIDV